MGSSMTDGGRWAMVGDRAEWHLVARGLGCHRRFFLGGKSLVSLLDHIALESMLLAPGVDRNDKVLRLCDHAARPAL